MKEGVEVLGTQYRTPIIGGGVEPLQKYEEEYKKGEQIG